MSGWDQVVFQLTINIAAILLGGLLGSVLAELRGRRKALTARVERLETQVNELRSDQRRRSYSYR
jgi:hypothetical protein